MPTEEFLDRAVAILRSCGVNAGWQDTGGGVECIVIASADEPLDEPRFGFGTADANWSARRGWGRSSFSLDRHLVRRGQSDPGRAGHPRSAHTVLAESRVNWPAAGHATWRVTSPAVRLGSVVAQANDRSVAPTACWWPDTPKRFRRSSRLPRAFEPLPRRAGSFERISAPSNRGWRLGWWRVCIRDAGANNSRERRSRRGGPEERRQACQADRFDESGIGGRPHAGVA